MNKKLDLNTNVAVLEYNKIDVISQNKVILKKTPSSNIVFRNMPDCIEIEINKSGDYKIEAENKNIKIKVLSNLEVKITEVNLSQNLDFISSVQLDVLEGSKVTYLVVDTKNKAYNYRLANVLKKSHLDLYIVGFNVDYNENKIIINLEEEYASSNLKLITLANNNTESIYEGRINNNAPKTSADIWQKAVIKNGGSNDFIATGFIKKGADDASNYQESRVLLLDKASLGNASPLLLIDHFNVVAGHAAGVSRVNEDDLYYLQTRGIDKTTAEHLMTLAFVRPLVDLIEQEDLKKFVEQQIEKIIFG
ncbi:MAG: SufD family Fe-S cluster assembly protein [Mycoplasmatales bacterium]